MDHKIEKYMAIVEAESFTNAAARLHVSQPALSVTLQNLEKELGVQLIIRGGRFFQVTDEGRLVYEYGQQARLQYNNLKEILAKEVGSMRTLKVGMIDSVANALFRAPGFDISTTMTARIDNSSRLLRALKLDQLDMAIITKPFDALDDAYKLVVEYKERFELVSIPENVKEVRAELRKNHCLSNFSTYDQQSTTYRWINKHFSANGIELRPSFFSTSPEVMLATVLKGRGAALLPKNIVAKELRSKKLIRITGINFERPIAIVTLDNKYLSEEMKEIISLLKQEFTKSPRKNGDGQYA